MCIYIHAYNSGRQARIVGRQRDSNPYTNLRLADSSLEARLENSWDAGWIFGERAAAAWLAAPMDEVLVDYYALHTEVFKWERAA